MESTACFSSLVNSIWISGSAVVGILDGSGVGVAVSISKICGLTVSSSSSLSVSDGAGPGVESSSGVDTSSNFKPSRCAYFFFNSSTVNSSSLPCSP
ncbi:hypothetical protein WICPIJ_000690 [Wickerhamomyces pijperi]|uniref:Uncharacterized protein n=1 Tax=Wickerhamomyces pijperi TaxID=599730 RepID=A0A9P8TRK8_WICPI|nr:hypothetical protein WICPIJ_000690 [Wickerhamomyces pijperi]